MLMFTHSVSLRSLMCCLIFSGLVGCQEMNIFRSQNPDEEKAEDSLSRVLREERQAEQSSPLFFGVRKGPRPEDSLVDLAAQHERREVPRHPKEAQNAPLCSRYVAGVQRKQEEGGGSCPHAPHPVDGKTPQHDLNPPPSSGSVDS